MPTPYLDFEIEIGQGDGGTYPVAVLRSPAGEARAELTWPFSQMQLENKLLSLQNALLRSGGRRRKMLTPEEEAVRSFGVDLFNALFVGDVRTAFYESRTQAEHEQTSLRIKLRFQAADLAALPWEYLYDPRRNGYLCLTRNTPLVRYLELTRPIPPLGITPPLRILGMVASPDGLPELDVEVEKQRVERGLADLQAEGLVELVWLDGQSWRDLQRTMRRESWHIFHFIGHGGFDEQRGEGLVMLADRNGQPDPLTATQLAQLLTNQRTLRLAVFNSCEGARADRTDVFSSTAATLVQAGLPAVLAMQYEITDKAASEFAGGFYEALADNLPVDAAVAEARLTMSLGVRNSLEWGTPVLFMRSPDGVIFDLADAPIQPTTPYQPRIEVVPHPASSPPISRLPTIPIPFDWVEIPAGEFIMGSKEGDGPDRERPQHTIHLLTFHIARTPVTNAQYKVFVDATGHDSPEHWRSGQIPAGKADHPVAYVSWFDAHAFCKWAGVRLPTEAQWEKAARGTDGRLWPWGNAEPTENHCNFGRNVGDTTPVGTYGKGASPYGVLDMAGNVWEWTSSYFKPYPYDPEDGREDLSAPDSVRRVLRGGSFAGVDVGVRCAFRYWVRPLYRVDDHGFRVVSPGF